MIIDPVTVPITSTVTASSSSDEPRHQSNVDLIGDVTSWPSLSESTRSPVKSSPSPPSLDTPVVASQSPAVSHSSENHRHPYTNTTPNTNSNRQRSSSRGGSGREGSSRSGFIRHPSQPQPQQLTQPLAFPPAFFGGFEGPMRGPFFYGNNFAHHLRPTDHQFARPRGDGPCRYNHSNYHGPSMGYQMPPQQGPLMVYPIPPQQLVSFPFIHPPVPPESFMGIPPYNGVRAPVNLPLSVSPPSVSPPSSDIRIKLMSQINYYFSDENLVKDMYLRSHMDGSGWVPISLIANFNKVRELTQDIQLILENMRGSSIVEVHEDKLRRRNNWSKWITSIRVFEEPTTNDLNTIMRCLQNATLEEVHTTDRSTSGTNAISSLRIVST